MHLPHFFDGKSLTVLEWCPVRYRNIIPLLKNPFYAGACAYGKTEKRTAIVDGHPRKTYGHSKPFGSWEVMLQGHHQGYIDWGEFERNQALLAANTYGKTGGTKSGRGGRALLAGLLTCARCGRHLAVVYAGKAPGRPVYRCDRPNLMPGLARCLGFGGTRIDAAVAAELVQAVEPLALEAALQARRMHMESQTDRSRIEQLELQQARHEAGLAERRYAACDRDNRLIAAQLGGDRIRRGHTLSALLLEAISLACDGTGGRRVFECRTALRHAMSPCRT